MSDHTNYNKDRIMSNSSPTSTSLFNSAESDVVSKQDIDEENLLKYWNPNKKWYHPLICTSVTLTSQFVMRFMNQVEFHHRQKWDELFTQSNDSRSRGILSFSNHVSLFDDPLLIASLGHTRYDDVRWIAADRHNFFGTAWKGILFSSGKCVPIIRGAGLEQQGFHFLLERLQAGDWVHIFPEGGRTRKKAGRLRLPFKHGIGKLICEAQPIVMPFYHYGMHKVMPIGSVMPRLRQKVHVYFGDSHVIDSDFLSELESKNLSASESDSSFDDTHVTLDESDVARVTASPSDSSASSLSASTSSSHSSSWKNITLWCQTQLQLLEEKYHPDYKRSS